MMRLGGRWRSDAGGALVELAVALPVLVLILAATIDFARVFHLSIALTNAARAGAQYGAHSPARSLDWASMKAVAEDAVDAPGITAAASTLCRCWDDAGNLGLQTSCTSSSCPSNEHLVITVTVTVTKTFTTIITGFPAVPGSVALSRTATMRVQQ